MLFPLILVGWLTYWKYYPSSSLGRSKPPDTSQLGSSDEILYESDVKRRIEEAPGDYILEPGFHVAFMDDLQERLLGDEETARLTEHLRRHAPLVLLHIATAYASGNCSELSEMLISLGDRSGPLVCSRLERHRNNAISHRFVKSDTVNNLITYVRREDVFLLPSGARDLPPQLDSRYSAVEYFALMDLALTVENADSVVHRFYLAQEGDSIRLLGAGKLLSGRMVFRTTKISPPAGLFGFDPIQHLDAAHP